MILSGLTGIKRISPVSWKHVNFYGKYIFRGHGNLLPASGRRPGQPAYFFGTEIVMFRYRITP
jgi:hypothetical protein